MTDNFFRATTDTPPVSTGEVIPEITEAQKAAAWLELQLQQEMYFKNKQILFDNYK